MKRSHDSPSSPVNPTRSHPTNPASRHGATSGPTGPCSMGDTAAETTLMDSSLGFTMALPPGAITRLETGSYEAPCLFDDQEWRHLRHAISLHCVCHSRSLPSWDRPGCAVPCVIRHGRCCGIHGSQQAAVMRCGWNSDELPTHTLRER
jgi:hypothetical protein